MLHKINPSVRELVTSLQEAGYETYLVGGAVRDILMNREPKDYDVSTAATPEEVRHVFGRRRAVIIGRRFRLVHVRIGKNMIVEVSTFRRMPSENAGIAPVPQPLYGKLQKPQMILRDNEYGTAEEDAWRRDFTVNSIFYDPVKDQLSDFTGMGIPDLKHGVIRVIGDPQTRFEEDPVRLLRALKLVGQYGWMMEEQTASALTRNLHMIQHAASSRLALELEKILKSRYCPHILTAFREYGFLKYYLPWLDAQWQTDAAEYAISLLRMRNERISSGQYRDSVSIGLGALVLPFVESRMAKSAPGMLWDPREVGKNSVWDMIKTALHPHGFCQKISGAAVQMLQIQPIFSSSESNPDAMRHYSGYAHARELYLIQNAVKWLDPDAEARFPVGGRDYREEAGLADDPSRKKRNRRPRRRTGRKPEHVPDLNSDD